MFDGRIISGIIVFVAVAQTGSSARDLTAHTRESINSPKAFLAVMVFNAEGPQRQGRSMMAISAIHGNREAGVIFPNSTFIHASQRLLRLEPFRRPHQLRGDGGNSRSQGLLWWWATEPSLTSREGV